MSAALVATVVLVCTFGGALAGIALRRKLPSEHLASDSRDTVRITMGLVGSMTALVLGLVTASAKSSYDDVDAAVRKTAVELLALDRTLARFGPETGELRGRLRGGVEARVDQIWPESAVRRPVDGPARGASTLQEALADHIRSLEPRTELQRSLQGRAVDLSERLLEERWLTVSRAESSVPAAFVIILLFWLTATFGSYGLHAPANRTVVAVLFLGAVSVASALFLVIELGSAFDGQIKVSGEPLRRALELMAR